VEIAIGGKDREREKYRTKCWNLGLLRMAGRDVSPLISSSADFYQIPFYQIPDLLNLTFYQIPFYHSPVYQIPDLMKITFYQS
jgi:hypothetical protein